MARRQARVAPSNVDGGAQDFSSDLWDPQLSTVVRGLLTSAVRCFAANGYHATTTRDISAGVGLSPAALYVHFPSKELVLYEIIRSGHERALALIEDTQLHDGEDSEARLRRVVSGYTAWHARHHVAARVCQYELAGLAPEHYDHITELRHRTNEVFRGLVAAGVRDGRFAGADVNRVVRGMLSLSIDIIRWYRLDGSDSPEQLGDFYAELALRMLRAVPGTDAPRPAGRAKRASTATKRAAPAAGKRSGSAAKPASRAARGSAKTG